MTVNLTPATCSMKDLEKVLPRVGSPGVAFHKQPRRKGLELVNKAITNNSIVYDNIDKFLKVQKYRKPQIPNISRALSRENQNPASPLPMFMDNIHDRNSIKMLSRKMLESNHFSESKFQTVQSSFDPKKSFRRTGETFGSPVNKFAATGFRPGESHRASTGLGGSRGFSQASGLTYNGVLSSQLL